MKTYLFKVVLEPDDGAWSAYCPALLEKGGSTWGATQEEALKNIREVMQMVVESMIEHNEPLPETTGDDIQVFVESRVAVTV
jgi:predicted RNase H-like HicB family nuclease